MHSKLCQFNFTANKISNTQTIAMTISCPSGDQMAELPSTEVNESQLPRRKKGPNWFSRINEQVVGRLLANQEIKQEVNRLAHFNVDENVVKCSNKYSFLSVDSFAALEDQQNGRTPKSEKIAKSSKTKKNKKKRRSVLRRTHSVENAVQLKENSLDFLDDKHVEPIFGHELAEEAEEEVDKEEQLSQTKSDYAIRNNTHFSSETNSANEDEEKELRLHKENFQAFTQNCGTEFFCNANVGWIKSLLRIVMFTLILVSVFVYAVKLSLDLFCPCNHNLSLKKTIYRLLKVH